MLLTGLATTLLAALASLFVTWVVLRNAARVGLIAVPNARSSHSRSTPSGGGVGIVAGGTLGGIFVALQQPWPAWLLGVTALLLAVIGLIDDRRPLPAGLRLGCQLLLMAAAVVLALPWNTAAGGLGQLALVMPGVLVLLGVYWLNIFNFMDGIDGLAASQAVFMCGAAALLVLLRYPEAWTAAEYWWLPSLAAASLGFLILNWPPARIFMGDAGSTYLGYLLAALAFSTILIGWISPWQWLILAALFMTDATMTLVRRLLQRERIFEAHRRHAYQVLSRRWRSHRRVTGAAWIVNLVWILPLAAGAGLHPDLGFAFALAAYAPLAALALVLGAGAPEASAAD